MTWEALSALALALPGVEAGASYGTPALRVRKTLLARLREDGESVVLPVGGLDEQEALIASEPAVYFLTDHYQGWPCVLVRLASAGPEHVQGLLVRTWRAKAPKRLVSAYGAERPA